VSRPQPDVVTVHADLLPGEYRDVVAHLGGQLLDPGHSGLTLNPFHPAVHELVADDPISAGDPR